MKCITQLQFFPLTLQYAFVKLIPDDACGTILPPATGEVKFDGPCTRVTVDGTSDTRLATATGSNGYLKMSDANVMVRYTGWTNAQAIPCTMPFPSSH
ncbi:hypothetical protein N9383_00910 [Granulosicoccus sp.]|nr:hypothetical protein [Granulosicoccus sp.]